MENIWLGRFPKKMGFIDHEKMYEDTLEVFKDLNIEVDPKMLIGKLSVSQRQMVEIAKAVSYNAKILVLDEPTNHLDVEAKDELKKAIKEFKGTVLLVCHEPEFYSEIVDDVWNIEDFTTKIV